jgi:hypothetical protein
VTRDDLIDLIIGHLRPKLAQPPDRALSSNNGPKGRLFLTEYDIKKRLTADAARLTIPKEAILSPLAVDWLVLKGIEVVRE